MKKLTLLLFIMTICINITALKIGEKEYSLEELKKFEQKDVKTSYEKRGELRKNTWTGIPVQNLLEKTNLWSENSEYVFQSADNYLVRLYSEQLPVDKAIIALKKDGEELDEEHVRLIVKDMRDMFWIRGLATISRTEPNEIIPPEYVFNAVNFIKVYEFNNDPGRFKEKTGYKLSDFLSKAFPRVEGEFTVFGKDGVNHTLDFDQFLTSARVLKEDNSFSLKSEDIPGGMWIKNLICIIKDDRAVFFANNFNDVRQILSNLFAQKNLVYKSYLNIDNEEKKLIKSEEAESWEKALMFQHLQ